MYIYIYSAVLPMASPIWAPPRNQGGTELLWSITVKVPDGTPKIRSNNAPWMRPRGAGLGKEVPYKVVPPQGLYSVFL